MIYITQGHQSGVGLEVFLKAALCFNQNYLNDILLVSFEESLLKTLHSLNLNFDLSKTHIKFSGLKIPIKLIESTDTTESTRCLEYALNEIESHDVLLTLPTSKNQLEISGRKLNGYTEYLRTYFKNSNITMNFVSPQENILLLTDHISVDNITKNISKKSILEKIGITLKNLVPLRKISDVYFSGIDPHCGESGQISKHDLIFDTVILELEKRFPSINFHGPYPADTLHLKYENRSNQLFVYAYHDQGLGPFKLKNGLVGINLSLGLPFIRVSVDHGTAFNIFGKNQANYQGMLYLLKEIEKWT